jgi:glycopeptide antibiotics resistance protein
MNEAITRSGLSWLILLLYFFIVFYLVFFSSDRSFYACYHEHFVNLMPFEKLKEEYRLLPPDQPAAEVQFYKNLVGNILLFIPFAPVVRYSFHISSAGILVLGFFCSLLIELIQFLTYLGVADVDDLVLNTLGLVTGIVLLRIASNK